MTVLEAPALTDQTETIRHRFTLTNIVDAVNNLKAAQRIVDKIKGSKDHDFGRVVDSPTGPRLVVDALYEKFQASTPIAGAAVLSTSGDVRFPMKDLTQFLKPYTAARIRKNPDETFEIHMDVGTGEATFRCGNRERTVPPSVSVDLYDPVDLRSQDVEGVSLPNIPVDVFSELLPAVSTDDARTAICGVSVDMKPAGVRFRSTDSYRAYEVTGADGGVYGGEFEAFTIPRHTVELITRAKKGTVDVFAAHGEHRRFVQVIFEDGLMIHAQTVDGAFPNTDSIFDGMFNDLGSRVRVDVDVAEIVDAVDIIRKGGLATANTPLTFTGDTVSIRSDGKVETHELPKTGNGTVDGADPVRVGFNPKYFGDLFTGVDDATVRLYVDAKKPSGFEECRVTGGQRRRLLMPVRIA